MKSQLLVILVFALFCFSCGSSSSSNSSTAIQDPHSKAHQQMHDDLYKEEVQKELANLASSIAGVYKGYFPCADCADMPYELELYEDLTYTSKTIYQGASEEPFKTSGTFAINPDWTIELKDSSGEISLLQKEGDYLNILDKDGQIIQKKTEGKYVLKPVN